MINTNAFSYINVLNRAADASWLRNNAIANNIANVDTPGYKRQDVSFEEEFRQALTRSCYTSLDGKVRDVSMSRLQARPFTDYGGFSYRLDGNNVDIDQENIYLAENQLRYQGLMSGIQAEFKNLHTVIK